MKLHFSLLLAVVGSLACALRAQAATQQQVADYVRDHVLGGSFGEAALWLTSEPLDSSCVTRDLNTGVDTPFPFPGLSWLVLVDAQPADNFGHPCRFLFVRDDLSGATEPVVVQTPPSVWAQGGAGPKIRFRCEAVTPAGCPYWIEPPVALPAAGSSGAAVVADSSCLHAILVSGGCTRSLNFSRYACNLRDMYRKLRACGYPKANIKTLYADGANGFDRLPEDSPWPGDCDGDGRKDVDGAADAANVRATFQEACRNLGPRDVLLIYLTNHGQVKMPDWKGGTHLWDANYNDKAERDEVMDPEDLWNWLAGCKPCRVWIILDHCYSGRFLQPPPPPNVGVYVAATDDEPSKDRYYLDGWLSGNPATSDMDQLHAGVGPIGSTPGSAQGSGQPGKGHLCECCDPTGVRGPTWGAIKSRYR